MKQFKKNVFKLWTYLNFLYKDPNLNGAKSHLIQQGQQQPNIVYTQAPPQQQQPVIISSSTNIKNLESNKVDPLQQIYRRIYPN